MFLNLYNGLLAGSWGGDSNNAWFGVSEVETIDMAIFCEGNYDVTEDFTVTVGGRWYDNEIDRDNFTGALSPNDRAPNRNLDYVTADENNSVGESGFVGKLGVRYNIDYDKMVYATYSEGFRSGGANLVKANSNIPQSFESDFLKNHEVGFKTSWMDNRLRVNAAVYRMAWEDIQLQIFDNQDGVFSSGVVNFAEAQIDGVETEIIFAATEGLEISLTYAYIEAEISEDDTVTNGSGDVIGEVIEGAQLPITPDQKGSLGLEYNFQGQWFGMDPYVKFDYSYTGNSVSSMDEEEAIDTPHYETMDIAVGMANDVWSANLKLENLEDERAVQFFNQRWGSEATRASINKPRNLTLTVRRSF